MPFLPGYELSSCWTLQIQMLLLFNRIPFSCCSFAPVCSFFCAPLPLGNTQFKVTEKGFFGKLRRGWRFALLPCRQGKRQSVRHFFFVYIRRNSSDANIAERALSMFAFKCTVTLLPHWETEVTECATWSPHNSTFSHHKPCCHCWRFWTRN